MKVFENLTMFEQRILCHKLPNSFNNMDINDNQEYSVNKRNKMIQELKRQMLNSELEHYELRIQNYEDLYEQKLATFQSEIYRTESSYQIERRDEIMYFVKIYVHHNTQMLLRQIRYNESCFHVKLQRHHRRYKSSRSKTKTMDVYPQIIVDVPKVQLNQSQLDYLSHTGQ
jgi:hypothetical protein